MGIGKPGWRTCARLTMFVALLSATAAHATTLIVPPDPKQAVQESDVVVIGTVKKIETVIAPNDGGAHSTEVTVQVDEVKKGTASKTMRLHELGGLTASGGLVIYGAPTYRAGDRVLVLATYRWDGLLQTHLMDLGRIKLEDLPMAKRGRGALRAVREPQTAPAVSDWKARAAEAAGELPSASPAPPKPKAEAPSNTARTAALEYRYMGGKWTEPARVVYDEASDPSIGDKAAVDAMLDRALGAWQGVSGVQLQRDGESPARGFTCEAGKMLVSFNDPRRQVEDPAGCSGVLAVGGFCLDTSKPLGGNLSTISASALVFNNGWSTGCPQFWTMATVEEIATHEVGHTIGLSHSCEIGETCDTVREHATMYAYAHFDARTSKLFEYDIGAAQSLYGNPAPTPSPAPAATASPQPTGAAAGGGCGGGKGATKTADVPLTFMVLAVGAIAWRGFWGTISYPRRRT